MPNSRGPQGRGYRLAALRLGGMFPSAFRGQAEVAQLVEQLIRNQQVTGSSPVFGSTPPPRISGTERASAHTRQMT